MILLILMKFAKKVQLLQELIIMRFGIRSIVIHQNIHLAFDKIGLVWCYHSFSYFNVVLA